MVWAWLAKLLTNWRVWVFLALVLIIAGGWGYWAYFTNKLANVEAENVRLEERAKTAESELLAKQKALDGAEAEKAKLDSLLAERERQRIELAGRVGKLKSQIKELEDEKSRAWLDSQIPPAVIDRLRAGGLLAVP